MEHIARSFIVFFRRKMKMENSLVRRDQFNISPQGIVHKPTDAAFTPYVGDPYSGMWRLGQLGQRLASGNHYDPKHVRRIMSELWVEYVSANSAIFARPKKTKQPPLISLETRSGYG
jgi:hypothetical protein